MSGRLSAEDPFFEHGTQEDENGLTRDEMAIGSTQVEKNPFFSFKAELEAMFAGIEPASVRLLYEHFKESEDKLALAINAYLDHPDKYQIHNGESTKIENKNSPETSLTKDLKRRTTEDSDHDPKRSKMKTGQLKFIGCFEIECWCTRFVLGKLQLKDELLLSKNPDNDNIVYINKTSSSQYRQEIGRCREESAKMIAPFLPTSFITFNATLSYMSDSVLRTGDSFFVKLDCYLNTESFDRDFISDSSVEETFKAVKRTSEEADIFGSNDKRTSLIKLLRRLGLLAAPINENLGLEDKDNDSDTPINVVDLESQKDPNESPSRSQANTESDDYLTVKQLRSIYKTTELQSSGLLLPDSNPEEFELDLRPYQKYALSWMLLREREYTLIGVGNTELSKSEKEEFYKGLVHDGGIPNPLWKEINLGFRSSSDVSTQTQGEDFSFYLNIYNGSCSLERPLVHNDMRGGILADEMGLGKTITTLSLIATCSSDSSYTNPIRKDRYAHRTTLIVLPMTLLSQWESEFSKANGGSKKKCFVYYGNDTLGDLSALLCDNRKAPEVVLTTYGTVQSEATRCAKVGNKVGLFSVTFFRVILDEGHIIRNKSTKTAKGINLISARRKWILTGTPIVNRLDDLYSLLSFLNVQPWTKYNIWKYFITEPFNQGKNLKEAFSLLKSILDPILLRRTKHQKDKNGNLLVELPSKEIVIERLKFNEKEEALYNHMKSRAIHMFTENLKHGSVLKNYSSILTQLLRLRQICCHVDLIRASYQEKNCEDDELKHLAQAPPGTDENEGLQILRRFEEEENTNKLPPEKIMTIKEEIYQLYPNFDDVECSICTSPIEIDSCVITECKHCFCLDCLMEHFLFQSKLHNNTMNMPDLSIPPKKNDGEVFCPNCRHIIHKNRLFRTLKSQSKTSTGPENDQTDSSLTPDLPNGKMYYVGPFNAYEKSTKVNALMSHLHQIREENPNDHVIVFSQFTSFLDIVENELKKYGNEFKVLKFDGRLTADKRQTILNEFNEETSTRQITILLLSLKAGGVGLNLTVASKAFLLDPHWNNATEFQAIDRVHRLGQKKNVKVIRFIMEGTIEERMLKIQERKNQLGEALSMNDEERRKKKIEEIEILFKE
ncbi:hypothetical protein OGAPHI_002304 [Ogataea philodendri]|uniref:DNA repair protein RAD5 n=1 Tax=Ogataea philodendri TaxID=1378263 RepID=A0A9P8PB82_9ASCO|nr:uncharacterized protein OGAPHI_002304 [Ogataea philodendri]KAH3668550.1 hypothetical protein OGAPHI_002304 [Ogataea philodendri]